MKASVSLVAGTALALAACAATLTSPYHQIAVTWPSPATLTAELYLPSGSGPFPTLILLHGCAGINANIGGWARWLTSEGYAALVLDSFGGRGLRRVCGDGSVFSGGDRSNDVYAAAKYLAGLTAVDAGRLGAIGWSHGGWTVLRSATIEDVYPDVSLRALVTFYPYCGDVASYRARAPLLILHGEADDWTPVELCRYLAENARAAGRDVTLVAYPGAHHGFDVTSIVRPTLVREARQGRGATIAYDPSALRDAEKRLREFLRRHLKMGGLATGPPSPPAR
jgi:dienelactone hydrolase